MPARLPHRLTSGRGIARAAVASAALALPLLALTPAANATNEGTLINFEHDEDFTGSQFSSVDHNGVTFCELNGDWVQLKDHGFTEPPFSSGKALYTWKGFAVTFAKPVDSLELSFGNDLGGPPSEAVLKLYLGQTEVDTVRVTEGGDVVANQVIASQGHTFNRATLAWDQPGGYGVLVDNVVVGAPVDAPNPAVDCETGAPVEPEPEPQPEPIAVDPRECTIVGTSEAEVLVGTPERDVICGRGGDDVIKGLGGDDLLIGGAGDDKLRGFGGDDEVRGNAGRDLMWGGAGTDTAVGGDGLDLAFGFEVLQSARSGD